MVPELFALPSSYKAAGASSWSAVLAAAAECGPPREMLPRPLPRVCARKAENKITRTPFGARRFAGQAQSDGGHALNILGIRGGHGRKRILRGQTRVAYQRFANGGGCHVHRRSFFLIGANGRIRGADGEFACPGEMPRVGGGIRFEVQHGVFRAGLSDNLGGLMLHSRRISQLESYQIEWRV